MLKQAEILKSKVAYQNLKQNKYKYRGNVLIKNFECQELNLENAEIVGNLEIQSNISELKAEQIRVKNSLTLTGTILEECVFTGGVINGNLILGNPTGGEFFLEYRNDKRKISLNLEDLSVNGILEIGKTIQPHTLKKNTIKEKTGVLLEVKHIEEFELTFYPNWDLADIILVSKENKDTSFNYASSILYSDNEKESAILLSGISAVIHELNRKGFLNFRKEETNGESLLFDELKIKSYLKFFCEFVWGDEGPFQIVESSSEIKEILNEEIFSNKEEEILNNIIGITLDEKFELQNDSNNQNIRYWESNAFVLYAGHLFKATFKVFETGMVAMVDDQELLDLSKYVKIIYDSPFRKSRTLFFPNPIREVKGEKSSQNSSSFNKIGLNKLTNKKGSNLLWILSQEKETMKQK